jgi:hypothetical protein
MTDHSEKTRRYASRTPMQGKVCRNHSAWGYVTLQGVRTQTCSVSLHYTQAQVGARTGGYPHIRVNNITPTLHMSHSIPYDFESIC